MSLILDALNRADQERSEDRPLPDLQASQTPQPDAHRPWLRWILEGLVVLLAIAALVFALWGRPEDSAATKPPPDNIAEKSLPSPQTAIAASTTANAAKTSDHVTASQPVAAVNPPPAPAVNQAAIAELYQQPVAANQPAAAEADSAPPAAATTATATAKSPNADDEGQSILEQIPLLSQRSLRFQRRIPSIEYSMHVYAEENGKGFVVMNGKQQRVGSQPAAGLRVIAILKNSIVLDYQGTQFRLAALNSWANF